MDRLLNGEFDLVVGQVLLQDFHFDMLLHLFWVNLKENERVIAI